MFFLYRLLRWSVFFSTLSLQPHSCNIRSSIPCLAGKRNTKWLTITWQKNLLLTKLCYDELQCSNNEKLLLSAGILLLYLLSFPEHSSPAVRCCTLFGGTLASVHSSTIIISPLQTSPHMAAQSQFARGTRCAWMYESLGKVCQPSCLLRAGFYSIRFVANFPSCFTFCTNKFIKQLELIDNVLLHFHIQVKLQDFRLLCEMAFSVNYQWAIACKTTPDF